MGRRHFLRSFAGGEIAFGMTARIDDGRYQTGAAKLRNMLTLPHGPAVRRPGLEHIAASFASSEAVRLIPFEASAEQSFVIELGDLPSPAGSYARIIKNGALIPTPGSANPIVFEKLLAGGAVEGLSTYSTAPFTVRVFETSHPFQTGDTVSFSVFGSAPPPGTGSTPLGMVAGRTYWVERVNDDLYDIREGGPTGPFVELSAQWGDIVTPVHVSTTRQRVYLAGSYVTVGPVLYVALADTIIYSSFLSANFLEQIDSAYTLITPYDGDKLFELNYTQSNDVLTITHEDYPPYELRRYADDDWRFEQITFDPKVATPTNPAATVDNDEFIHAFSLSHSPDTSVPLDERSVTFLLSPATDQLAEGDLVYVLDSPVSWLNNEVHVVVRVEELTSPPTFTKVTIAPPEGRQLSNQGYVQAGGYETYEPFTAEWEVGTNVSNITRVGHGISNGTILRFGNLPSAPPAPVLTTQSYIVLNATADTFQIATLGAPTTPIQWTLGSSAPSNYSWARNYSDASSPGVLLPVSNLIDNTQKYKVTAVGADNSESAATAEVSVFNNLYARGSRNVITWTAVSGAVRYNVYKETEGIFGFIGQTEVASFIDDNIAPDTGITPPIIDSSLSGSDYPRAVGYFDQRRVFAGTPQFPQAVWMTRPGTETDLTYTLPVRDDNRVLAGISAHKASEIRHVVPLSQLLLLTSAAEYRLSPVNDDAITPTTLSVRLQTHIGASRVVPAIVNNNVVFESHRGGYVYTIDYNALKEGYVANNLSIRAADLFTGFTIRDMTQMKAPWPIVWMSSSSGKLLGLTFLPDQEVVAWHQHDTGVDGADSIESVCAIPEGDEDRLYVVVNRGGARHIERMAKINFDTVADGVFTDGGGVFEAVTPGQLTVGTQLNGVFVDILADGAVLPAQQVSGGEITMTGSYNKVIVGRPYRSELWTLPVAVNVEAFAQGLVKNVNKAFVRVEDTGPFKVGPSLADLDWSDPYAAAVVGATTPTELRRETVPVNVEPDWEVDGQIYLTQELPLPLKVLGLTLDVTYGS